MLISYVEANVKVNLGSIALLSKFPLLMCENDVNPVAQISWATSTAQIEIAKSVKVHVSTTKPIHVDPRTSPSET